VRADLRLRLEAAAAARSAPPDRLLDELLERALAEIEAEIAYERAVAGVGPLLASAGDVPEPELLDAVVPPALRAVLPSRDGWHGRGRGYVPEPKAPRLFRARRDDGIEVAAQIAFGPEPGPSLSVGLPDGRHSWADVIMPLRWIVVDLVPAGWRATLDAAEDVARRLRAGEDRPPGRYGTDPAWGYPVPVGDKVPPSGKG
jgi:hypothetical protein